MRLEMEYKVTCKDVGMTYRDILRYRLNVSATQRKRMKQQPRSLTVNGVAVFATNRAKLGDEIKIVIEDAAPSQNIVATKGKLDIVYEDSDLFVVNKQGGVPTHPSHRHYSDSLANHMMYLMRSRGEAFVFRPVNRLDNDTSGLMLVAKSAHAQTCLTEQLHTEKFNREYIALVCGKLSGSGTVNAPIARADGSVLKREVSPIGAPAVTHYEALSSSESHSLVRLRLETGRTHQIRVHMAHIGHPLLGDFLYGERSHLINRTALHSASVSFIQPLTGERLQFTAPPPKDFDDTAHTVGL